MAPGMIDAGAGASACLSPGMPDSGSLPFWCWRGEGRWECLGWPDRARFLRREPGEGRQGSGGGRDESGPLAGVHRGGGPSFPLSALFNVPWVRMCGGSRARQTRAHLSQALKKGFGWGGRRNASLGMTGRAELVCGGPSCQTNPDSMCAGKAGWGSNCSVYVCVCSCIVLCVGIYSLSPGACVLTWPAARIWP